MMPRSRPYGFSTFALLRIAALALLGVSAAVPAHSADGKPPVSATSGSGTITMQGTGSVSVPPDMAVVTTRVVSQAKTAPEALARNTEQLTNVIAEIKAAGIAPADIQTSGFSIYPRYDHTKDNAPPRIAGYEVRNGVSINVRELDKLGPLLDTIVRSGANAVDGISFEVSEPDEKMDEARRNAVDAAKRKATLFAEAAGAQLGSVMAISETGISQPRPMMMMRAMAAESAPVPIEAGENTLSASVTITWSLTQ